MPQVMGPRRSRWARSPLAAHRRLQTHAGVATLGTTSIEEVAAAAPTARKWFQLYVWRTVVPAKNWSSGPGGGR